MEDEKEWILYVRLRDLPGVEIIKAITLSEIPETIRQVRELLPEISVAPLKINNVLRKFGEQK